MYLVPEYSSYLEVEGDGKQWGQRDSYGGSVTGVRQSDYNDYNGVEVPDTHIYAVVVGYQTGDTFGYDFAASVVDAFETIEEANGLAQKIDEIYGPWSKSGRAPFEFEYNDKKYYASWNGYFESLQSVEVIQVSGYRKKYR